MFEPVSTVETEDHETAEPATAEQKAALHYGTGKEPKTPQDGTESTTFDTGQHSDAPGPFGTS